jgi:hypothetical protein
LNHRDALKTQRLTVQDDEDPAPIFVVHETAAPRRRCLHNTSATTAIRSPQWVKTVAGHGDFIKGDGRQARPVRGRGNRIQRARNSRLVQNFPVKA